MNLRLKLFLPMALVFTGLMGYLVIVWLPSVEKYQVEMFHRQQERATASLVQSLLPMVAAQQLGDIHDTLDSLRRENPEWVEVELTDSRNRRLYPLPGTAKVASGPGERLQEHALRLGNDSLGILRVRISEAALLESLHQARQALLGALGLGLAASFFLLGLVLDLTVRRPVQRLAQAAHALKEGGFHAALPPPGRDEVGDLVVSFTAMRDQVRLSQSRLEQEVAERREAEEHVRQLNAGLETRIREEVERSRQKDHILIQQSRLAAMGEMVHNIAHQWRQPLNALGLLVRNLKDDYDYGELTAERLDQTVNDTLRLLQRMSTTVDDFREFFRPDKEKADFDVAEAVRQALFIIQGALKNYSIAVDEELPPQIVAEGFPSQFAQAVLNILMNAKEAIQERHVADGSIRIRLTREGGQALVSIEDNGGGIPAEALPRIFDPYFTTKDKGSGIGLYMTKMIVEKNMDGSVTAANTDRGARFTLALPLSSLLAGNGRA
ncbi:MAG: histidine kinase,HAMP protein,histidine kinase [Rhodocyclaceae bacterium]|nr:histidine kinase,HAMP protein,histidine kinase [Rhodocyclaceae bacterium]